MKTVFFFVLFLGFSAFGQQIKFKNALVIGQFDKSEDRYAMELNLVEILQQNSYKAMPSFNVLKQGENLGNLLNDSIQKLLKLKGIDSYVILNVRGYDRRFKSSEAKTTLKDMLDMTSIYHIYRDEATSVTFEFTFFDLNNQLIGRSLMKCGNVSDRDSVMKRFRKKLPKMIIKEWKS
jgi:DNA repair protein RadC